VMVRKDGNRTKLMATCPLRNLKPESDREWQLISFPPLSTLFRGGASSVTDIVEISGRRIPVVRLVHAFRCVAERHSF